jgi:aminocarboxymuconate-semialdehyde decarboxylase
LIIDVHRHIVVEQMLAGGVPAGWRPVARRAGGRYLLSFRGRDVTSVTGEFTEAAAILAEAAAAGVDHLLLSPWITLVPVEAEVAEARAVCQVQNDALMLLSQAYAGRVSAVGAVVLQDPPLAARQVAELAEGGLAGVEVPASAGGRYLGDDFFAPFWEAAEAAGALVFIHPTTRGFGLPALDGYYLWNSVGNPLETAITAAHMTMAGVLERHPGLRVLLAHGGGALPVVRGRLRRAFAVRPEATTRLRAGPDATLRRFYYDTVTHDHDLLAGLVGYAGPRQVMLGSDRPFDMGTGHPVEEVRALRLGDGERWVLGGNAAGLLGVAGGLPA